MSLREDLQQVARHSQRLWLVLLGIVPLIYLLSGFYSIGAEQRGILIRFGKLVDDKIPSGMHYHLPWPIESVEKLQVTAVRSMELDFAQDANASHVQLELTTGDENLINVALILQYNIQEAGIFQHQAADPEQLLRQIAQAESIQYVASQKIGDLLTTGRNQFQSGLQQAIQQQTRILNLGINITSVQIRRLEPPQSIKQVFDDVAVARAEKQEKIQVEQGERSSTLAKARSDANRQQQQAQAYASELLARASGDRDRLLSTWEEYRQAPALTGQRMYLEMLEQVMPKARVTLATPSTDAKQ
jgi:membrane protease subunit HflK